jgi:predicted membrane protein (TIGR00267 family)
LSSSLFEDVKERAIPYIINTLFDAVFTIMGIVIGSAFSTTLDLRSIIGTIVTASLSLGVSSGFSVYEAETLEEEKRIDEIEEAMLENLDDTMIAEESKQVTLLSAGMVFFTPFMVGIATLVPFIMVYLGTLSINRGVAFSIGIDLFLIFLAGYVFALDNRLFKGIRMTVLGLVVFAVGYLLNNII